MRDRRENRVLLLRCGIIIAVYIPGDGFPPPCQQWILYGLRGVLRACAASNVRTACLQGFGGCRYACTSTKTRVETWRAGRVINIFLCRRKRLCVGVSCFFFTFLHFFTRRMLFIIFEISSPPIPLAATLPQQFNGRKYQKRKKNYSLFGL